MLERTVWQLKQDIHFCWYRDGNEYLLYAEEAGEMLLLNEMAYQVVFLMQQSPEKLFSLAEFLFFLQDQTDDTAAIYSLMLSLLKKHLVNRLAT